MIKNFIDRLKFNRFKNLHKTWSKCKHCCVWCEYYDLCKLDFNMYFNNKT